MRFFLDNCMAPGHAEGLQAFSKAQEHEIADTTDLEWISALGREREWIIISGDVRITRNPAERAAWYESGLTAFFFGDGWSSARYWKQAAELVTWWERITETAKRYPNGHGFILPKGGKQMRQIYPVR